MATPVVNSVTTATLTSSQMVLVTDTLWRFMHEQLAQAGWIGLALLFIALGWVVVVANGRRPAVIKFKGLGLDISVTPTFTQSAHCDSVTTASSKEK